MATTGSRTNDVFISHSASDSAVAREIADGFESAGLATFHAGIVEQGDDVEEAIWEALAESRALVAVVSPDVPPHAMGLVEIGAAGAWNKPVVLIINGPSSVQLPAALSTYPAYPLNRLDEVIRAVRTGFEPLSEDEREMLAEVYKELGVPADYLSQSTKKLRDLTVKFNRRARKQLSGERLMSEILRLRKKGQLPRLAG